MIQLTYINAAIIAGGLIGGGALLVTKGIPLALVAILGSLVAAWFVGRYFTK